MFVNIKSALLLRSMRQFELARKLEVSESFLSLIIAGRREASPAIRQKAASLLCAPEDWLFKDVAMPSIETRMGEAPSGGHAGAAA